MGNRTDLHHRRERQVGEIEITERRLHYHYVIHKTARVEALLQQMGAKIRLHVLPPYCPDHNRIERLWQDLHANVTRNHRHRSMRDLLAALMRWLKVRFTEAERYVQIA